MNLTATYLAPEWNFTEAESNIWHTFSADAIQYYHPLKLPLTTQ